MTNKQEQESKEIEEQNEVEEEQEYTCKCGCGESVKKEDGFRQGHYIRWKAQQKALAEQETTDKQPAIEPAIPVYDVLSVREFHPFDNKVAWFMRNGYPALELLEYYGIIQDMTTGTKLASILMLTEDGLFVPLIALDGFMGVYPDDQEFSTDELQESFTKQPDQPGENESETESVDEPPSQETIDLIKELADELP